MRRSNNFTKEVNMAAQEQAAWPLPDMANTDRPFWEEAQKGNLVLQKCHDCGRLQFLPRPVCVNCFSRNLGWQKSDGTGSIYSLTGIAVPRAPASRKQVEETGIPIIYAAIDLDEGVRVISEIIGSKPEEVKLGDRVKVCFEEAPGTDFKLPRFQIVK
jgi:uncharacterized OB-fold protein